MKREINLLKQYKSHFDIDLSGLTIITECANGPYRFNALLPLLCGAKKVIAIGRDSRFGTYEDCKKELINIAKLSDIDISSLKVTNKLDPTYLRDADIITNSGWVRPINKAMIDLMKPTAVIPLMWETWEYRDGEIDLDAARQNGVLVMGTDETCPLNDMRPYSGMMAIYIMFKLGLEGYGSKVALFGGAILGESIASFFDQVGIDYMWFIDQPENEKQISYGQLGKYVDKFENIDMVLIADHEAKERIFTSNQGLTFSGLSKINDQIVVGIISGDISYSELALSGLSYYPGKIEPPGYMSFQCFHLGAKPVIQLFAAGLKVGEVLARIRLDCPNVRTSAKRALEASELVMDFEGDKSWLAGEYVE